MLGSMLVCNWNYSVFFVIPIEHAEKIDVIMLGSSLHTVMI